MSYHELSIEERATIQVGSLQAWACVRQLACWVAAPPQSVEKYDVTRCPVARTKSLRPRVPQRRVVCRPAKKLLPDSELFELVVDLLCRYFSPEQIAGTRYALSKSIPSDCFWPRVCKNAAEDYSLAGRALNATNSCSVVSAVEYCDSGRSSWFGTRNLLHKHQARQKGIKP